MPSALDLLRHKADTEGELSAVEKIILYLADRAWREPINWFELDLAERAAEEQKGQQNEQITKVT